MDTGDNLGSKLERLKRTHNCDKMLKNPWFGGGNGLTNGSANIGQGRGDSCDRYDRPQNHGLHPCFHDTPFR